MKLNSKSTKLAAMGLIALITYTVIFFIIFGIEDHEASFWTSFAFMMIAFGATAVSALAMGKSGMLVRDWLFGYPIIKHSTIYLIIELILSTIYVLLEEYIPFALAFTTQLLILAVYMVFAISCFLSKQTIQEIKTKVDDKTRYIKLLRADTEMLASKCQNPVLKAECQKFAEAVRFSDPMSNDALFELEKELALAVSDCDHAISQQNDEEAFALLKKANTILQERNKKCKALK